MESTKSWAFRSAYSVPSLLYHFTPSRRVKVQVRPSSLTDQSVARPCCATPYWSYWTRVSMKLAESSNSVVWEVTR